MTQATRYVEADPAEDTRSTLDPTPEERDQCDSESPREAYAGQHVTAAIQIASSDASASWTYTKQNDQIQRARKIIKRCRESIHIVLQRTTNDSPLKEAVLPLIDNKHFLSGCIAGIEESFRTSRATLLPSVDDESNWTPRITRLCNTLVSATRCRIDRPHLVDFFSAYQEQIPLDLAELWLLPDLCSLSALTFVQHILDELQADHESGGMASNSASHDLRRSASAHLKNAITTLRFITNANWKNIVESLSATRRILAEDPSGQFELMDIETRNAYLSTVARLSAKWQTTETLVANHAIQLARSSRHVQAAEPISYRSHVGYFLIDDGVGELASVLGKTPPSMQQQAVSASISSSLYLSVRVLSGIVAYAISFLVLSYNATPPLAALLLSAVVSIATYRLQGDAINFMFTRRPSRPPMPRLDYSSAIPIDAACMVVVSGMLDDHGVVEKLLKQVESQYLRNRSRHIHYALLSDFSDASTEETVNDGPLLATAVEGIRALNHRYAQVVGSDIFHLFHRPRLWNPSEEQWMGRERKRGKLHDLNALLLRGEHSPFKVVEGSLPSFRFRYVIALDSDTQLPAEAAARLIATIDHPLVRPHLNRSRRRVEHGYVIIQPLVTTLPPLNGASLYSRLWGGRSGLDPYSFAKADLYHDLFAEGSYIGKGIYDIEAFETIMSDRLPDNRILSHDLLEGCFARCTVANNITVLDDYPQTFAVDMERRKRWIRGDWQIAAWIRHKVPVSGSARVRNELSALSRFKIFDNLARSAVMPALLALLIASVLVPTAATTLAIAFIIATIAPSLVVAARTLVVGIVSLRTRTRNPELLLDVATLPAMALFELACLPFSAICALSSVAKIGWRLHVSHKRLLEWRTFSQTVRTAESRRLTEPANLFAINTSFSLGLLLAVFLQPSGSVSLVVACTICWLCAPFLDRIMGRRSQNSVVPDADRAYLDTLARRSWAFFEDTVGSDTHWLPPDNLQEYPERRIAQRTSPTNIGLGLLATCSAHDLGYAGMAATIRSIGRTLHTLRGLHRDISGHLYNWYDTRNCKALEPRYVSAVDSGNYVGHLMVVRQFLREASAYEPDNDRMLRGLATTVITARARAQVDTRILDTIVPFLNKAQAGKAGEFLVSELDTLIREIAAIIASSLETGADSWNGKILEHCIQWREDLSVASGSGFSGGILKHEIDVLIEACDGEIAADFSVFFDRDRQLFCIGMDGNTRRLDAEHYDMLASEARLAVYVAVAKGNVSARSWYALGRLQTEERGEFTLLSWSGSMFEYLMPEVVMPSIPGTLLHYSVVSVVRRQRLNPPCRGVPWGVSESGYAEYEADGSYRYQAFGLESLALKPDLDDRRVVAPYASALACLVDAKAAVENLRKLEELGAHGSHGFYEGVDFGKPFTESREGVIVREYMAHHIGMSLLAFADVLTEGRMRKRFCDDPELRAAMLLLAEQRPSQCMLVAR